jgi:hypothetical protein
MFIEFKDAQFVAEARTALPEALDYITELEAQVAALEAKRLELEGKHGG